MTLTTDNDPFTLSIRIPPKRLRLVLYGTIVVACIGCTLAAWSSARSYSFSDPNNGINQFQSRRTTTTSRQNGRSTTSTASQQEIALVMSLLPSPEMVAKERQSYKPTTTTSKPSNDTTTLTVTKTSSYRKKTTRRSFIDNNTKFKPTKSSGTTVDSNKNRFEKVTSIQNIKGNVNDEEISKHVGNNAVTMTIKASTTRGRPTTPALPPPLSIRSKWEIRTQLPKAWSGIDWNRFAVCGQNKCLFHSIAPHAAWGYLLSNKVGAHKIWEKASQLDIELHQRFGGPEPLTYANETVQLVNISNDLRTDIRKRVRRPKPRETEQSTAFQSEYCQVAFQRVRLAPDPHQLLHKKTPFHVAQKFYRDHVANSTAFAEQFAREIPRVTFLLDQVPALYFDFQVFVDTWGNIYQMDLDRHFERGGRPDNATETAELRAMYEQTMGGFAQDFRVDLDPNCAFGKKGLKERVEKRISCLAEKPIVDANYLAASRGRRNLPKKRVKRSLLSILT